MGRLNIQNDHCMDNEEIGKQSDGDPSHKLRLQTVKENGGKQSIFILDAILKPYSERIVLWLCLVGRYRNYGCKR